MLQLLLCYKPADLHLSRKLWQQLQMAVSCRPLSLCFMAYIILSLCCVHTAGSAKILAAPAGGSHWLNMKTLMTELWRRGHTFIVLRPSNSLSMEEKSNKFSTETIQIAEGSMMSPEDMLHFYLNFALKTAFANTESSIARSWNYFQMLKTFTLNTAQILEATFENKALMERLQAARFDLVLADSHHAGGYMLAHYLKIPVVSFGRLMPSGDIHFAIAPSPLSYVPVFHSRLTDKMGFTERFRNFFLHTVNQFLYHLFIYPVYDDLCRRYLKTDRGLYDLYKKADIYLIKVDFVFEFPRPTMPNAVYIGGFQCKTPKALPTEIQEFMDSSGEEGVVVFSLGSLVHTLPLDIANKLAAGLALLPERVIWRYTGETPSALGNNTKLLSWLPQNDILSHPKTKAFIAHGGESGINEAIHHGVAVVGIPLFSDQYENILRLKSRGAAILLEKLSDITSDGIYKAVRTVIDDPSYRANMKHLSALQKDVIVDPMEAAIFWTEFTIRHKGASHLQAAGNDLPFYQYYMLDVIGLIMVVLFLSVFIAWKLFKAVLKRIHPGLKKRKKD